MNKLIDSRNSDLWNFINANHSVQIEIEDSNQYRVVTKNNQSIIYVSLENQNPASFTHELLHIFLHLKNVPIGGAIKLSIRNSPRLKDLISEELLEHINNCIEHVKMLPLFLAMGYAVGDFLADYSHNKLTYLEIELLAHHFDEVKNFGQTYSKEYIDFFIAKFFAATCCPNNEIDYSGNLGRLKGVEQDLYDVLDRFLISWKDFDYDTADIIEGGYRLMVYEFVEGLEKWTQGKVII
jgi:hypothetical protein